MGTTQTRRAHSRSESGHEDPVAVHLADVSRRASEYASAFGGGEEAALAGLLHDLGKYGDLFQKRLAGEVKGIDHWSPGAWAALKEYAHAGIVSALAIQGHHLGLQQAEEDALRALNPSRLSQAHPRNLTLSAPDSHLLTDLLTADGLSLPEKLGESTYGGLGAPAAGAMLDVRMLFSALVDADFIETEAHFEATTPTEKGYRAPGPALRPEAALEVLLNYLACLAATSDAAEPVRLMRQDLLAAAVQAADLDPGLFTLTAPTGAGKTLSMLAFALRHAAHWGLRRIVTVIPYLTIIEQTAAEYRKALAAWLREEDAGHYVLEDHSLARAAGAQDDEQEEGRQARLLAENWDAPIVVTTSVQLLESLFANRPGRCRKLHRLARSVILFDEVQTVPTGLAVPTLATLSRLAERYGATVVFSTATQPAFTALDDAVRRWCAAGWQPREVVPDGLRLFERARRTRVDWPTQGVQAPSWDDLADLLCAQPQALCILNLKRHALALFGRVQRRVGDAARHLSTSMCPAHRQVALAQVRQRHASGEPCCLVSTQCVEAGVDVDFPVVFPALAPLDAVAQAAGRCNRNGRLGTGTVHVFRPPEDEGRSYYPDGAYQQGAAVTESLLRELGAEGLDLSQPALFDRYYQELYVIRNIAQEDDTPLLKAMKAQHFAEVGERCRLIAQDAISILVPYDPPIFRGLADEAERQGLTRQWIKPPTPPRPSSRSA